MKPILFFKLVILSMVTQSVVGQDKGEEHFYLDTYQEIKTIHFTEIKDSIALVGRSDPTQAFVGAAAAILGMAISELVPILVEKVGLLAYNPQKYISEYGTSYLFNIDALRSIETLQKITYTRTGTVNNSTNLLTSFTFELKDLPHTATQNLKGYSAIALETYQNNYTGVKLKNSSNKMNMVAEVALTYYDAQDHRQELQLQPYKLSDVSPRGPEGSGTTIAKENRNYQIVPPMKFIETLTIKIVEVNDRKKDWDTYLEIFNRQKDNLSGLLIDQLK